MPFCTQCGHQASDGDIFCAHCGSRQTSPATPGAAPRAAAPPAGPPPDPLASVSPRTAAILCYIPTLGWIAAVVVLASRKFRTDKIVRFHAFQGLYLFAAWLLVEWFVRPLLEMSEHAMRIDRGLEALILAVSILMMVKAAHDEPYVLPIIGELAQKSAAEQ